MEQILGRYQPLYYAGEGGFARVVVAYDTNLRREVAIKCIPIGSQGQDAEDELNAVELAEGSDQRPVTSLLARGPQAQAGVTMTPGLEEARMAAMLNDSAIVQIYDFEVQGQMAYLIMENMNGLSLATLLDEYEDRIDADVVAAVFKAVAQALTVAHKANVLHLDIKPDNVLIDTKGNVKVADFGLATLASEEGFGTAEGGTIGYMPIEQMRAESLDARCDEWALASLTYEMISGERRFDAPDLYGAEDAIFDAELVLPSLCMEGIDKEADDALFKALEPYAEDRYETVRAFGKALQSHLGEVKAGKRKLAALAADYAKGDAEGVDEIFDEDEDDEPARPPKPPYDPFSGTNIRSALRVASGVNALALGYVSFGNILALGGWNHPWAWICLAVTTAVAVVFPRIGTLASLASLAVMLITRDSPTLGAVLIGCCAVWFVLSGRAGMRQSIVVASPAALGAIGLGPLSPLLAGWLLRPREAALGAACSAVVAFALGSIGTLSLMTWDITQFGWVRLWDSPPANAFAMVQDPSVWITAASWVLAAALAAVINDQTVRFKSERTAPLLATAAAGCILLAGVLGATFITGAALLSLASLYGILHVACSVLVMICLSTVGVAPLEGEED